MTLLDQTAIDTAVSIGQASSPGVYTTLGTSGEWAGMASMGKMALGLLVVIALIFACSAMIKRMGALRHLRGDSQLRVISAQQLGQRERIVMVETEDARLVLGVTPHTISVLHTLPPSPRETSPTEAEHGDPVARPTFKQALAHQLKHSFKRSTTSGQDRS